MSDQRYRPKDYLVLDEANNAVFGEPGAIEVEWRIPPGGTITHLYGAVLQHLVAMQTEAAMSVSKADFCATHDITADRFYGILSGTDIMTLEDVGWLVSALGETVMPDTVTLAGELEIARDQAIRASEE